MHAAAPASSLSLGRLAAAPHRLLFFVGATNVLLAMLWWTAWLTSQRFGLELPQPSVYGGWLHAYVMQYQMLPSFIFGFLLTVFPRWMGQCEIPRWRYAPVGLGLFGGQLATLLGAIGWDAALLVGWIMTAAGWVAGLATLGPLLRKDDNRTWHARSCFAALVLGLAGLCAVGAFLLGATAAWMQTGIKLGGFGLLLPVYLTVAHRMFPFFAGNVVPGYRPWRPLWLLGAFWALCLLHLALELGTRFELLWLADLPLFALSAWLCWRWWPRGPKPALLTVLFVGLLWLPVTFALYSVQSLAYLLEGMLWLGRAPAHALFVGFFGSVLVAMVTRVTQGHSGQALVLPRVAGFAFVAIQLVTVLRIGAELATDGMAWQTLAALGWLIALAPWVLRLGRIYLSPRSDGKPG